ncbi:MAG: Tol-Pal system protein TolB [Candidatus Protochlamydia sp.]|nr:Tol-Pal system protein TolB [Candidatus Protochlamydia sp.]
MKAQKLLAYRLFLPLLFILPLFSDYLENEAIIVQLATESPLVPIYIASFKVSQGELSEGYSRQLEQVLRFDWEHNGSTYTLKANTANDQLANGDAFEQFGAAQEWDSQNILYVIKGEVSGKQLRLAILNVKTRNLKASDPIALSGNLDLDRRLVHKLSDSFHKAIFGKDGIASTRILYTIKTPLLKGNQKLASEVWEADYDGKNARQVTHENSFCVTPAYIPAKPGFLTGGFLYVSYKFGQPKIFAAQLKNGEGHRIMELKGNQMMPALSPQRDKIAFISDITGNPDLFVQPFSADKGAIGKPEQIFSAKQATQSSPAFSPDGKQIAFVSDKDGAPKVYVINIPQAGTSLKNIRATLLTKRNRENSAPAWSPDGTKIAYCARSKGERQIWVYDFTTGQERELTQGPGNKENPSWAPDSLHLVFNSADANDSELYLINLNQPESTKITSGIGEKRYPSWEPRL